MYISPKLKLETLNASTFEGKETILSKIHKLITPENFLKSFIKKSVKNKDLKWLSIKLETERNITEKLNKKNFLINSYERIIDFVASFVGLKDGYTLLLLRKFIVDEFFYSNKDANKFYYELQEKMRKKSIDIKNNKEIKCFINFFYMHGN